MKPALPFVTHEQLKTERNVMTIVNSVRNQNLLVAVVAMKKKHVPVKHTGHTARK